MRCNSGGWQSNDAQWSRSGGVSGGETTSEAKKEEFAVAGELLSPDLRCFWI
jgi:hypothetical protein